MLAAAVSQAQANPSPKAAAGAAEAGGVSFAADSNLGFGKVIGEGGPSLVDRMAAVWRC